MNFTDIEVMSVSRHKSISGLKSYERSNEKLQSVSLKGLVEAIITPGIINIIKFLLLDRYIVLIYFLYIDQTLCNTSSIAIDEQEQSVSSNYMLKNDRTSDTISTPGFRSALQVIKGIILFISTLF